MKPIPKKVKPLLMAIVYAFAAVFEMAGAVVFAALSFCFCGKRVDVHRSSHHVGKCGYRLLFWIPAHYSETK